MGIIDKLFYKQDKKNSERRVSKLKYICIAIVIVSMILIVSISSYYHEDDLFTITPKEIIISDGLAKKNYMIQ